MSKGNQTRRGMPRGAGSMARAAGKRAVIKRRLVAVASGLIVAATMTGCTPSDERSAQPAPRTSNNASVHAGVAIVKPHLDEEQRAALAPVKRDAVRYPANRNLGSGEVTSRFAVIDATYAVGEPFNAVDAEFVRAYATPNDEAFEPSELTVNAASTVSYNASGGSGTKLCKYASTMSHSAGLATGSWSTVVQMSSGSAIQKVKIATHPRSYGVIGKNGVGLTYSADPSYTTTLHSYTFQRSANYSSVLEVYFTIYNDLTCFYSNGSFTVK